MTLPGRIALGLIALGSAACDALGVAGSLPHPPPYRLHRRVCEDAALLPARVVVLPPKVDVFDASPSDGWERADEWSRAAASDIEAALVRWSTRADGVSFEVATGIDPEQGALVEHTALFQRVARAALSLPGREATPSDPDRHAWWHKIEDFDYTLGPGLASLARHTGADAGVLATGIHLVPATGPSTTHLVFGVIDFGTGDLLWVGQARDRGVDARSTLPAARVVATALQHYRGIEEFDDYRGARGGRPR